MRDPRVALSQKIAWGLGGLADNFMMNAVVTIIMPIYNIGFGVSAIWLGVATAVPRFLDALTDPVRKRLRTSNLCEALNKQIRRRTRVAAIFPNPESCLRLVSAILMEISEAWETSKAYLNPTLLK